MCGGILIDDSPLDLEAHPRSLRVCDGKMRSEGAASGTFSKGPDQKGDADQVPAADVFAEAHTLLL